MSTIAHNDSGAIASKPTATGERREYLAIIGGGRSGTTLLSHVLDRHPEIYIAPETKYFQWVWSRRHLLKLLPVHYRRRSVLRWLLAAEYSGQEKVFPKHEVEFARALEHADGSVAEFHALLRTLSPKKVLGEKSPWHTFCVRQMLTGPASARFIAICRGAPAVVASMRGRKNFRRVRSIPQCVARWRVFNREILRLRQELPQDRLYLLRFEDLVTEPQAALQQLCSWLNVDFIEAMLAPTTQDSSFRGVSRGAPGEPVGFDTMTLTRWKEQLALEDIDRIHALTRDIAIHLGYEPDGAQSRRSLRDRINVGMECMIQRAAVRLMRSGLYFIPPKRAVGR